MLFTGAFGLLLVVIAAGAGRDVPARPARDGDGPAQVGLRRQRLARSQDPALADPHVRRDARDGPRDRRGDAAGVLRGHHARERAALPADRQRARLLAHRGRPAHATTWRPVRVEPLVRETVEAFAYLLAQQGFKVDVAVAARPARGADGRRRGEAGARQPDRQRDQVLRGAEGPDAWRRLSGTAGSPSRSATRGSASRPRSRARIFEKFYRVGRSETQGRRGSGVGLALVRHIAEAHGGRVSVESRPGEGSRFTLWLPRRRARPEARDAHAANPDRRRRARDGARPRGQPALRGLPDAVGRRRPGGPRPRLSRGAGPRPARRHDARPERLGRLPRAPRGRGSTSR